MGLGEHLAPREPHTQLAGPACTLTLNLNKYLVQTKQKQTSKVII